ncbi:DMT family transporter [Lysinibacillus sp. JNUCC-52]|uniref:DMT family transporter n=1 Tax=Lysinibacillus sp. JNUCC-52 TaxID=2792480 RepID=UPI0030814949
MKNQIISIINISLAMSIVGSSVVAGKLIVQSFPVFLASELRFLVATIILVPILLIAEGMPSIRKKDYLLLFLQALSGVFLFNIFMLFGLTQTTATEAGLITSTVPACTGLLSFFLLKEKLTKNIVLGICIAMMGITTIHAPGMFGISNTPHISVVGNLLVFGAIMCESLFIIVGKFISRRVSALAISTIVSCFGTILFLPFALYESRQFAYEKVSFAEWGIILYFGIVVTVIAFILMHLGIAKVSASMAGILTGFLPISSIALSSLLLGEAITSVQLIGCVLVLVAIFYLSRQPATK